MSLPVPTVDRPGWAPRVAAVGLTVASLAGLGTAGLVLLAMVRAETGSAGLLVGTVLALLPVVVVTAAFLWLDRWEPEPPTHLLRAFLWGATVAALAAVIVNSWVLGELQALRGEGEADRVVAILVAPVVEEAAKGAFLVLYVWWHRHEFDGVVDGVVLAGLTAAGFAFTENILYFGRAYTDGLGAAGELTGAAAAAATFVGRGLLSPFAHPLFTVMTGLGIGVAMVTTSRLVRAVAPLAGFLSAVVLHAMWNASALLDAGERFLPTYVAVMVPVFCLAAVLAVWSRRREGETLRLNLPAYVVAGWLAPWEVPVLASLPARRAAVAEATRRHGTTGRGATRAYHAAATELAFLRARVLRGTAGADARSRETALLEALVTARRSAFVPRRVGVG